MSYNRKALSKAKLDLDKYKKPNPYKKDILYTKEGQWRFPGQKTRIPSGDITMQGVPFPVFAQPNVGQPQMMYPGQEYNFPGASYVDETPMAKKGGLVQMPKLSKKGLASKKYSRSLSATNKLFTENPLFKKPKSKKRKVFDPNAKYFQPGGETDAMNTMMKARLAYANEFGNPAAQRIIVAPDQPYIFTGNEYDADFDINYNIPYGEEGTHFMGSTEDNEGNNVAVPYIQEDPSGNLIWNESPLFQKTRGLNWSDNYSPEIFRGFHRPEDAMYFAEHYKDIAPDPRYREDNNNLEEIEKVSELINTSGPRNYMEIDITEDDVAKYVNGGYIVEELPTYPDGGHNKDSIVKKPFWHKEPMINPAAYVNSYREGNPKMYSYGFLAPDKGNTVIGGGLGFPRPGIHLNASGVLPMSSLDRQYFKGAYEAGISKDIKNLNLGLGVNTAITGYPGENGFVMDPVKLQPKINLRYNFEYGGEKDYRVEDLPEMQPGGSFKPGTGYKMPALSQSDLATVKKEVAKAKPVAAPKAVAKKPSSSKQVNKAKEDAAYEKFLDQNLGKEGSNTYTYVDPITGKTEQREYSNQHLKEPQGILVDEATWNANRNRQNMQHLSEALSGVGEVTGINSAIRTGERIIDDPLKFADDLTTGISQAPETLVEGAMTLGSKLFGDDKNYVDVDTDALGVTLDVAGALPVIGTAGKVSKPLLKTGSKYLTKGPLKNAYKINPWGNDLERRIAQENLLARQIYGDDAYSSFLSHGASTQPNKTQLEQLLQFAKHPESEIKMAGTGEVAKYKSVGEKHLYPYFAEGKLWYNNAGRQNLINTLGDERIIIPKQGSNLTFFPAGERGFITNADELSQKTIQGIAGKVKVGAPFKGFDNPSNYDVYSGKPHWLWGHSKIYKEGGYINKMSKGGLTSPKDLDPATLEKYLSDLRGLENSIKKGYKNDKWYPHASVEGGANTIAYGHKLQPGESFSSGLTEQQARDLQKKDVLTHQTKAEKFVDDKYGKGTYDKLPQNSQMLLTDYAYNLGSLNKFPSFVEGVVKGDKNKMLQQYERRGLNERNKWTKNVINTTDFSKGSDEGFTWFNLSDWWNKKNGGAIELKIKNKNDLKRLIDQGYIIEEL